MEPWHWWWPGMGLMWILPLSFLLLMIVSAFRGRCWFNRDDDGSARRETARDILDRRYAYGEITREQFEEMKHTLER